MKIYSYFVVFFVLFISNLAFSVPVACFINGSKIILDLSKDQTILDVKNIIASRLNLLPTQLIAKGYPKNSGRFSGDKFQIYSDDFKVDLLGHIGVMGEKRTVVFDVIKNPVVSLNLATEINKDFKDLHSIFKDALLKSAYYNSDLVSATQGWNDSSPSGRVKLLYRLNFPAGYPSLLSSEAVKFYQLNTDASVWQRALADQRKVFLKDMFQR